MKKTTVATHLFLTGGLGNQLFQVAAAIDLSENGKVILHDNLGRPRVNSLGVPEIQSFTLPKNISIQSHPRFNKFISKVLGFNLRCGFRPTKMELAFRRPIALTSNIVMSIYLRTIVSLVKSSSLGYDSNVKRFKSNRVLVGYFQTFLHIGALSQQQFVNFSAQANKKVYEYKTMALSERPLVVHIRLGDYVHEDEIGILSYSYYKLCLNEAWNPNTFGKIWLFSDEPQKALERIPVKLHPHVRVIDSADLSSAETLQIMTYGSGYVIGNSTFSWWGAYLRENQAVPVYCPQPWFKNMDEPKKIVPDQWKRVNGFDFVE